MVIIEVEGALPIVIPVTEKYNATEEWINDHLERLQKSEPHRAALKAMDPAFHEGKDYLERLAGFLTTFSELQQRGGVGRITPDHVDAARIALSKTGEREKASAYLPSYDPILTLVLQRHPLFPLNVATIQHSPLVHGAIFAVAIIEASQMGKSVPQRRRLLNLPIPPAA